MAKEFAKGFYNSKEWKKCRAVYIQSVFGLCERCGKPGYIVHHKNYLRPENMNDMGVLTGFNNLEYLCQDCHNAEHHAKELEMGNKYSFDADGNIIPYAPHKNKSG
jgi:5-methylcytosine-specific restriction endonuclease McrA